MKTFLIVYAIFVRATRSPGSFHKALRLHGNAARASLWLETIPKVNSVCFPNTLVVEHASDAFWEFPNGARLYVGGLDEGPMTDKILGTECATIFFNECSQIPYGSVETALSRLAQNVAGDRGLLPQRAYYDLNPVGKGHWSYQLFQLHLDPVTRQPLPDPENYKSAKLDPADHPEHTKDYLESLKRMSRRQRARFYEGEYQDEAEDALWSQESLDRHRAQPDRLPKMVRVVVGVDPSGAGSVEDTSHDMIGIVVVGVGSDGHAYVLADYSCHASPAEWGRKVVWAFEEHRADRIIGEANYGGAMVEHTIRTADSSVPYKKVISSRGKHLRAEPVAALYEDRSEDDMVCRVHHVAKLDRDGRDHLMDLEDELCEFTTTGYAGERSPNRADALVFAVTELMLGASAQGWVEFYGKMAAGRGVIEPPKPKKPEAEPEGARMRTSTPNSKLKVAGGVVYESDAEGLVVGVKPEHVAIMERLGASVI